jgi:assimilatory nitrate reductase catalytic subunit
MVVSLPTDGRTRDLTVQGDPDFPVNRGQMCIKGFTSAALIDHPARLTAPLVRTRTGVLAPVSWDTALDEIAERLSSIRARHGAESLAVFGSGALTNEKAYTLGKFARVALRTPHVDYNGRYCMASAAAAQMRAFGIDRGLPFPVADLADTGTLMLWGANVADTMPPLMQWIAELRARGGALIVVDPRRTETARAATLHLQPTPGTDLALANGLLHIAIAERLIDQDYIANRTEGFDDVRRSVLGSDPTRVERLTGVAVEQQRRAVRLLAGSERSMTLTGRGAEQQSKGTDTVLALINLMLALGKVGKPASGFGCLTGQGNGQGGREHGQKADQLPGYRSIEDDDDRRAIARVWGIDPGDLPGRGKSAYELLEAIGPAGIRGLLVFGSNLAVASPSADHVGRQLRRLELLVVSDAFENETTAAAHVVLPTSQWAEESGTLTNLEGRVVLRAPVRDAPTGVKTDIDIMAGLASRLGCGDRFAFDSSRAVFDELRRATAGAKADYSGITYERLRRETGLFWPCPTMEHPGTPRLFSDEFPRPGGRARFHEVPYRAAAETPDAEYPFYFTTGRYREHYNSGAQTRRVAQLVEARPEPRVEMHPELAARLHVEDGARVLVESRRGAVSFVVALSLDVRADTLFAPFHWGGRQAANVLTNPALDPRSRMPEFKVCAVRVRPGHDTGRS